jgi:hypothetical protein
MLVITPYRHQLFIHAPKSISLDLRADRNNASVVLGLRLPVPGEGLVQLLRLPGVSIVVESVQLPERAVPVSAAFVSIAVDNGIQQGLP